MCILAVYTLILCSLWVSRTGSTSSDWCALQEALCKCVNTIQNNIYVCDGQLDTMLECV